jgi:hypothetical protein
VSPDSQPDRWSLARSACIFGGLTASTPTRVLVRLAKASRQFHYSHSLCERDMLFPFSSLLSELCGAGLDRARTPAEWAWPEIDNLKQSTDDHNV